MAPLEDFWIWTRRSVRRDALCWPARETTSRSPKIVFALQSSNCVLHSSICISASFLWFSRSHMKLKVQLSKRIAWHIAPIRLDPKLQTKQKWDIENSSLISYFRSWLNLSVDVGISEHGTTKGSNWFVQLSKRIAWHIAPIRLDPKLQTKQKWDIENSSLISYIYFRNWISRCWNFGVQLVVWRYSQKSNVDIRWWICENIQKNSQPLLHFARKCWCNTCPKLKLSTQLLPGQSSGGDVQWWWGQGKSDGNVGVYIYRYVLAWLVTRAEGSSTLQPAIFVAHSHLILCSIGVHSKALKSLQPGEQTHNHL